MTKTTATKTCPFNCCGVKDCTICLNPVTGEFDELEDLEVGGGEDAYVGYYCDGSPIGG